MTLADEQTVRASLAKYETALFKAVHSGWEDWRALQLSGRLIFQARSRACVVYDFVVQHAIAAFVNDASIMVLTKNETIKFVINDVVVLRFKKASENGLGSNIQTQSTLDFIEQQQELPGLQSLHKVELVYVLNQLQTRIEDVMIVARDGNIRLWGYSITADANPTIVSLPTSVSVDAGHNVRIKLRSIDDGNNQEKGRG
jgi:hypothetical protein